MANTGPGGYIAALQLSAEWEASFADAIVPQGDERQLAISPSKLREFVQSLKAAFDTVGGENPAVICSSLIRPHVRTVVERSRPTTVVLAQQEIHPQCRVRSLGTI
jgi:flagellar biosynthesis protein FlhA